MDNNKIDRKDIVLNLGKKQKALERYYFNPMVFI